MTREEFEAVLALEGDRVLAVKFIRGHRGKGRYRAQVWYVGPLRHRIQSDTMPTRAAEGFGETEAAAVQKLIDAYI